MLVAVRMCSAEQHTYLAFDTCVYLGPSRDTILSCMHVWQQLGSSFRILVPRVRCCPFLPDNAQSCFVRCSI